MDFRGALAAIEAGQLGRLYVIWGDPYLVGRLERALRRAALGDPAADFDLARIDASVADPGAVAAAVRTVPFSGRRRLVVLERARFLRARGKGGGEDDGPGEGPPPAAAGGGWAGVLADLPPTTCLVILPDGAPDNRLKLTKLAAKSGVFVNCGATGRAAGAQAAAVVREEAGRLGLDIGWRVQGLLVSTVGTDCGRLVQELEKLRLYCGDRSVAAEDVLKLCPRTAEADIWQLLDAIEAGRPGEASAILRASLGRGESPVALIASLASQVRIMARARERTAAGVAARALPAALGANRFWVEQSLRRARLFSLPALYKALCELARLDLAIKTGLIDPEIAVEGFVLAFCAARGGGRGG